MELKDFAETILYGSHLGDKLLSPECFSDLFSGAPLLDAPELPPRPREIKWNDGLQRASFPSLSALESAQTRGHILHFFANHELLALELMALTLLKFPDAPKSFRMGIAHTMLEEQAHMRLYIERMNELGVAFGDLRVNRFFWDCLKDMTSITDYVVGMSLTFEQANLDYASFYLEQMRHIGDKKTAQILRKVLDDEIGHVQFGVKHFDVHRDKKQTYFEAYVNQLRLPLTAARAKGQVINVEARRKAGLSDRFIDALRAYGASKGRPPDIYWYNSDCELEWMVCSRGYQLPQRLKVFLADLAPLMAYMSKPGDIILCSGQKPSIDYLNYLQSYGFEPPEFISCEATDTETLQSILEDVKRRPHLGEFKPWGWSASSMRLAENLGCKNDIPKLFSDGANAFTSIEQRPDRFFRKDSLIDMRSAIRNDLSLDESFNEPFLDGSLCCSLDEVLASIANIWSVYGTAVVKASYGAAGSGLRRFMSERDLTDSNLGWVKRQLKVSGRLLVEPWLDKLCEFSYVYANYSGVAKGTVGSFMTDQKGRYTGHMLGRWWSQLSPEVCRLLFDRGGRQVSKSNFERLKHIAQWVGAYLDKNGYQGPCGIDFFVFKHPSTGKPCIKLISEINPRLTMGHMASSLDKIFCKKVDRAQWRIINEADWQRLGYKTLQQFADVLLERNNHLSCGNGLIVTNDWTQAKKSITVLARGDKASLCLDEVLSYPADLLVGGASSDVD